MTQAQIEALTNYDALFLAAHEFDAPLSSAARLTHEARLGKKTLVAILFDGGQDHERAAAALTHLGVDQIRLRLPPAAQRSSRYSSFSARMFGREEREDSRAVDLLWPILDGLRIQTRARHVYLPLGAGEVDHRLVQDVGFRIFDVGAVRNVLLFEERPYSFSPGAIRMRLAQLGSRLPPALTDIGDTGCLIRMLWGALTASHLKHHARGIRSRARYLCRLAASWNRARGWKPRKAFGLRVQPIIHEASQETDGTLRQALESASLAACGRAGSSAQLRKNMQRYSRRLGLATPVERYWLVLPHREGDGVMNPASLADLPVGKARDGSAPEHASAQDPEATAC
ncbi:MAG: hypothetical protein JXO72_02755 [Vicinamibacteria bacterium]|nr:hypothetical protein [Vicinamibacteria bacterium]